MIVGVVEMCVLKRISPFEFKTIVGVVEMFVLKLGI